MKKRYFGLIAVVLCLSLLVGCGKKEDQQQTLSDVKPGSYKGTGDEVGWFAVTLVSTNDTLKVSEVGYKFTGSLEVERAFLKTRQPFGVVEKSKLRFQFPVFVKFSPNLSLTSEAGGSTTMAYYGVEIAKTDTPDQLRCKLTQIDKPDKEYEGFTMQDIGLATPDKKMQKEYTITLKRVAE